MCSPCREALAHCCVDWFLCVWLQAMGAALIEVFRPDKLVHNADFTLRVLAPAMMRSPMTFKSLVEEHIEFSLPMLQPTSSKEGNKLPHQRTLPSAVNLVNRSKLATRTPCRMYAHVQAMATEKVLEKLAECAGKVS